jgi:hypothetical protein
VTRQLETLQIPHRIVKEISIDVVMEDKSNLRAFDSMLTW